MHIRMKQLAAVITAATLTGAVLAQDAGTPPAAPAAQNELDAVAAQVSDEQLENFANAQKEVEKIRTKYAGEAQAAADPQKAAEAQADMQKEMVEAVQDNDLDVPTFNRIAQILPQSGALQQRLEQIK